MRDASSAIVVEINKRDLTLDRSGRNVRDTSLVMVVGRNERDMLGIEIVCVRPSKGLDSTFGTSREVSKKKCG